MEKLQELKKKYKELGEEIERLEKKRDVWKPEKDEEYYVIDPDGDVYSDNWANMDTDELVYEIGNCFKTREEAEKAVEKAKIYTQLKRLAEEENTEPIDWTNEKQTKYYIAYECHPDEHELRECYTLTLKIAGIIYCTNGNFLKIAKERIGEKNLLKLFKEE